MVLKQAMVVRTDSKMTKGRTIIEVVNISLAAAIQTRLQSPEKMKRWLDGGQKKVVLKVTSAGELDRIEKACLASNMIVVREETGVDNELPSNIIAIGIGPDDEKKIDKLTGHLKLL